MKWVNHDLGSLNTVILFLCFVSLVFCFYFTKSLLSREKGSGKQLELSNMIKEASYVYLNKQYKIIWGVSVVLSIVLFKIFGKVSTLCFFFGVIASSLSGFQTMAIATNSNVRTVEAAKVDLSTAFKTIMYAGAAGSLFLNTIGILSLLAVLSFGYSSTNLVCLIMGVSIVSIFARLGGGIFTKGADVGADMVGKNQMNLPEDDPRNPAVIADNVGDNIGDVAGMGADLCETQVASLGSAIIIGFETFGTRGISTPIFLCLIGILSSILPLFFLKFKKVWDEIDGYFNISVFLFLLFSAMFLHSNWKEFICVGIGALSVVAILKSTEYYTSSEFSPVKNLAEASKNGDGANVILGLATGFSSVLIPITVILASVLFSYNLLGIWGISLGVIGITALSPAILLLDLTGPISDNAGGIAEMSKCDSSVRKITDELDAVGNTTKAITKGYSIGSAIFASLIMFYFFKHDLLKVKGISLYVDIFSPFVITGLFIGAVLPFIFSGISMKSVSKAANAVVEEVRSQIANNPKILEGTEDPDYKKTVDFLTVFSIKQMILPGLLPLIGLGVAVAIGKFYNIETVFILIGSLLIGVTLTGSLLSIFMTVSGGLWDNGKKYIEMHGQKGSLQHKAAVTGDTIGDPFKDTTGPSLNSFIKFTNIAAVILIYIL